MAVSAERKSGNHAAIVVTQLGDDVAPKRRIHHEPVSENQDRPVTTRVLVLDDARRELNL
jgi:hypothetical protein